jgi:FdhE protein
MQRVLDPTQIEAFAQRTIPRVRLPDPKILFSARADRLRQLAAAHALADYLTLIAALCDAQQEALDHCADAAEHELDGMGPERIAQALRHGLPPLAAIGWPRNARWQAMLRALCNRIAALSGFPAPVTEICRTLAAAERPAIEQEAERLLGGDTRELDIRAAPFIMAALQVYWLDLSRALAQRVTLCAERAGATPLTCPLCGTLPVASVVHAAKEYLGYRYLHCALCATEWHLVRVKCTQCLSTEQVRYHFIEGGSDALRAESCAACRTYRKILYHEKDPAAEPVADDLASVALDLLMAEDGFRRASGNPLLWQAIP